MAVHPQTAKFRELLAMWAYEPGYEPSIQELRRDQRRAAYQGTGVELPEVRDLEVAGPGGPIPVRIYRPEPRSSGPLPALVYFHGGGWVLGDIAGVDALCRELAADTGCVVVSVGYRLAPENPFPAAPEDAWTVTSAVAESPERFGADPRAVAVAGDSAGGNLAAVTALRARDEGVDLVHQVLVNPVVDTAQDTQSWAEFGEGYGLEAVTMASYTELYLAGADPAHPQIAPLRAPDVSGVAPATVLVAECDILRDEGEAYAHRLSEAGVPVLLRRYPGVVHSFFLLPEIFDAGVEGRALVVRRLRAVFQEATAQEDDAA